MSVRTRFKLAIALFAILVSVFLTGCGTGFPNGLLYTEVTLPVSASDDPTIQGSLPPRFATSQRFRLSRENF